MNSLTERAYAELEAAISELDSEDRDSVIRILRDCADESDLDEPDVGIFANPRLAHLFRTVGCLIETVSA